MYKYQDLIDKIEENGLKLKFIWDKLGISDTTWYHRVNGRRAWKPEEIEKISAILGLNNEEKHDLFPPKG